MAVQASAYSTRKDLENQLADLLIEEEQLNTELQAHFSALLGIHQPPSRNVVPSSSISIGNNFPTTDFNNDLKKVELFSPVFEAMSDNGRKLAAQIEDCQLLSERLSSLVRKLDAKQVRASKALSCTGDILNLKDCKHKLIVAIEEKDLSAAVSCIRQVHNIDEVAAKTSEDFSIILEKEMVVKEMVRVAFQGAITESNTNAVMKLCPLLQTLGLETEARENFLEFMEQRVFIAVSADTAVEGTTDASTAYVQSLSSVFNSTYLIIQQYLPMVIQGLENSLGDVHFLRRLHKRCEVQAGLVLKRYMKFRGIRDLVANLKNPSFQGKVNQPELHSILDELALMIQFCCRYSKYLKNVCHGAETKTRPRQSTASEPIIVFAGVLEFDKVVDELVSKYYLEGEHWLVRNGLKSTLPKVLEASSKNMRLDECFFVLQKCGLRAVLSNNIHAACAVLNLISDLISTDLLSQAAEMTVNSVAKVSSTLQDHIAKYRKAMLSDSSSSDSSAASANSLSKGLTSLAATLTGGSATGSIGTAEKADIVLFDKGGFVLTSASVNAASDPWGVLAQNEAFNAVELCIRYTDRLSRELIRQGKQIFESAEEDSAADKPSERLTSSSQHRSALHSAPNSSEYDKIKLCKENFDRAKAVFDTALRQSAEKLAATASAVIRDVLAFTLGKGGAYGGLRFEERNELFDDQPILILLPKIILLPLETLVGMCVFGLSEANRELVILLLADACCERLEAFVHQSRFSLSGAMNMDEIIRSIGSIFSKNMSGGGRGKFSRLKELMQVLTSDGAVSDNISYTHLTGSDVDMLWSLRVDTRR